MRSTGFFPYGVFFQPRRMTVVVACMHAWLRVENGAHLRDGEGRERANRVYAGKTPSDVVLWDSGIPRMQ